MSERRWSLAGRLTAWFAGGVLVILVMNFFIGEYFLHSTFAGDINERAKEEISEAESEIYDSQYTIDDYDRIFKALALKHEDTRFGWRVWNPDTKSKLGDFLHTDLVEIAEPRIDVLDRTQQATGELWWRTHTLRTGPIISVVLDESKLARFLVKYQWISVARLIGSVLIASVVSWFLLGRISRTLRRVAETVRTDRDAARPQLLDELEPQEIRDVADALWERLTAVRAESDQAHLFTASLAHELRSPIQNLIGETEVALIAPRDANTYRRVLESHLSELRELGDAVDNLMTMCTHRGADSKALREEFDLAHETELRLAREQSRARLMDVTLELGHKGDTRLFGDREALLRALRNLAGNAIEWSPAGSTVHMELEGKNGEVIVTVDDNGPGVPIELREKVFEPFFTGPAKKGGRVGYGLGLAIARSAARDQGGTIEISSSPTGGARFRLVLPKQTPSSHAE